MRINIKTIVENAKNKIRKIINFLKLKLSKRIVIIGSSILGGLVLLFIILTATFYFHIWGNHEWVNATCTEAKICQGCHKTEGEPLGHDWLEADCINPHICSVCGERQGEPLGHNYSDPTCTEALKCLTCGEIIGKPLGHNWTEADCTNPRKCTRCGWTVGKAKGHKWEDATCDKPKTCKICNKTEGKANGHKWEDATYDKPRTCKNCGKTEGKALKPSSSDYNLVDSLEEYCDYVNATYLNLDGYGTDFTMKATVETSQSGTPFLFIVRYNDGALKMANMTYKAANIAKQNKNYDQLNDIKNTWDKWKETFSKMCLLEQETLEKVGLGEYSVLFCVVDMEEGKDFKWSDFEHSSGLILSFANGKTTHDILEYNNIDWGY